jgi:hypothetical protein
MMPKAEQFFSLDNWWLIYTQHNRR